MKFETPSSNAQPRWTAGLAQVCNSAWSCARVCVRPSRSPSFRVRSVSQRVTELLVAFMDSVLVFESVVIFEFMMLGLRRFSSEEADIQS